MDFALDGLWRFMAEILLFLRSLPQMVKVLGEIVEALKQLKAEAIEKELTAIRNDVDLQIKNLQMAANDVDRKKAILALSSAISK